LDLDKKNKVFTIRMYGTCELYLYGRIAVQGLPVLQRAPHNVLNSLRGGRDGGREKGQRKRGKEGKRGETRGW
jgi:hypothetical protein